jgi:NAD(P)-dependent dehydrogenase (short-subunit alcohol dehydrogenase family)
MPQSEVVFISSITSDIGLHCARRYAADGCEVYGTYRSTKLLPELSFVPPERLYFADLRDAASVDEAAAKFNATGRQWNTFMSCAAQPGPLTSFFRTGFDEWSQSVHVNAIEQLRALHAIGTSMAAGGANAVFYAGPATNNAVANFSPLALSKIMLIKMCELLDAENPDLNAFIVGPGWTRTKTHFDIINDPGVSKEKYDETVRFLETQTGTNLDDIYDCIRWCSAQGRKVAGGRNFSVVHDCWGDKALAAQLLRDSDMYKLRRHGNSWKENTN